MRAGKVLVTFTDGVTKWVSPEGARAAIDAKDGVLAKPVAGGASPMPMSGGQRATKFFADMLPSLGGFTGSLLAGGADLIGGAAAAPFSGGASMLPAAAAAAPAMAAGGAAGGALGYGGQLALYKLAGLNPDLSPGGIAKGAAGNAVVQGSLGGMSPLADAGLQALAPRVMKMGIGRAPIGAERKALAYGAKPTESYLDAVEKAIGAEKQSATANAIKLDAAGKTFDFNRLVAPVQAELKRVAANDVTAGPRQSAAQAVLDAAESKLGPQTTPASTILAPGRGGVASVIGPARPAVTVPARPISASQLQDIVQIAGDRLRELFKAKQANLGAGIDPIERPLMKLWARGKQMLESSGAEGKAIAAANEKMRNLYNVHAIASKAGQQAVPRMGVGDVLAGASLGGATALAGHNPTLALAGVPVAFTRSLMTSPEALMAEARAMGNPMVRQGIANVPRLGPLGAQWFGAGNPYFLGPAPPDSTQ